MEPKEGDVFYWTHDPQHQEKDTVLHVYYSMGNGLWRVAYNKRIRKYTYRGGPSAAAEVVKVPYSRDAAIIAWHPELERWVGGRTIDAVQRYLRTWAPDHTARRSVV